jgi:hypothetical protein
MLSLKNLWSSTATLGFAWTVLTVGPRVGWIFVVCTISTGGGSRRLAAALVFALFSGF